MIRDLWHWGPLTLRPYGLMLLLAFAVGLWVAWRRGRRVGIPGWVMTDMAQVILVTSVAGARFQYVLTHWEEYAGRVWRIFALWEGGLTFFAGGILATLAVIWWAKRKDLPVLVTADVLAPSVALGAAVTRVGCFLNGCCFGRETSLPWAVHFPPGSFAEQALGDVAVHPTQLYQSLWAAAVFFLLWRLGFRRRVGTVFWSLVALLPLGRLIIDFFRYQSPVDITTLGGIAVPNSQSIAGLLVLVGIVGLAALRGRPSLNAEGPPIRGGKERMRPGSKRSP